MQGPYQDPRFREMVKPKASLTPEMQQLSHEMKKTPEKSREVMENYTKQSPEDVYKTTGVISDEDKTIREGQIMDDEYKEKERHMRQLFKIAQEKGILVAVEMTKKLNEPALLDSFHDRLHKELMGAQE